MKLYFKIREMFVGQNYHFAMRHAQDLRKISDETIMALIQEMEGLDENYSIVEPTEESF